MVLTHRIPLPFFIGLSPDNKVISASNIVLDKELVMDTEFATEYKEKRVFSFFRRKLCDVCFRVEGFIFLDGFYPTKCLKNIDFGILFEIFDYVFITDHLIV
jgi:hypothetical protein